MARNESKILQIAQVKAHALQLFKHRKIDERQYQALNSQLDVLILEHVQPLPNQATHDWLDNFSKQFPDLPLSPLIRIHQSDQSAHILKLRQNALAANAEFLDLSGLYPGMEKIPLTHFLWRKRISHFREISTQFNDPDMPLEEITSAARCFFEAGGKIRFPAGFPPLSPGFINRLINKRQVEPQGAEGLASDYDRIAVALNENQKRLTASFFEGTLDPKGLNEAGENGYRLLLNRLQTWEPTRVKDLAQFVIQWQGPGFPELAEAWLKGRRSQKKIDLVLARTGIDLQRDPEKWTRWLNTRKSRNQLGMRNFHRKVFEDRLVYESLFILACDDLLDNRLEARWWPVLHPKQPEVDGPEDDTEEFPVLALPDQVEESQQYSAPETIAPAPEPESKADHEDPDLVPEDEAEQLRAPVAGVNEDNERVIRESTWNNLFKPFLVENWMGMIGAFSLLAAWLFFSLYFWDVGAIFRIMVAGALPLSLFTMGTGWSAKWIYAKRDQGASAKAALLFAILCHGSIPFNFIIAYSLFALQTGVAISLAILLGLAQVAIVFLVSAWIRGVLEMPQRRLIFMLDGPILLPFLVSLMAPEWAGAALTVVLFSGLVVLLLSLSKLSGFESRTERMNGTLAGAHYLLLNGVLYLYFRDWPGPAVLAAWLPCLALGFSFLGRAHPYALTAGAALCVLGNLIGLAEASFLPVSLVFTLAFWWHQQSLRGAAWVNEVLVLYLGLVAMSLLHAGQLSWIWSAPFFIPVFAAAFYLEKRPDQREIRIFSLGLMPLMIGFTAMALSSENGVGSILPACLVLGTAVFAYLRYVAWFRVSLWIFNLFLTTALLGVCLPFSWGSHWTPLYIGVMALVWAGLSRLLPDRLNRQHRTTILLALSLAGAGIHFHRLWLDPGFNPMISGGVLLTLFGFYTVARRAHSALPIYFALALAGVWVQHLRASMGLVSRSGLGSAIAALALLFTGTLLDKRGFALTNPAELFFMRPFLMKTKRFLAGPLIVGALVLTFISLYKTIIFFAPMSQNPKLAVALLVNTFLILRLAQVLNNRWLTNLAPITTMMFFFTVAISLPWEVRAHVGFFYAITFTIALDILKRRRFSDLITGPLGPWHLLVTALTVTLGLLVYLLYPSLPIAYTLTYGALAVGFLHVVAVRRLHALVSHVVLTHLFILMAFTMLRFVTGSLPFLTMQLVGGFILLLAPVAYLMETSPRESWKPYRAAIRLWLPVLPFIFATICLSWPFLLDPLPSFSFPLAAYFFLHLGNRYGNHRPIYFLKGLIAWQLSGFFTDNPLISLMLGLLCFAGAEWLLAQTNRWPKMRLQGYFPEGITTANRTAPVLLILTLTWLVWHLVAFFESRHGFLAVPHVLLFVLIPFMLFFYKRYGNGLFAFVGIGLVAYGSGFIFLGMPWPEALSLTPLHGLNLGLLLALGVYFVLGQTLRSRGHMVQADRVQKVSVLLTILIICSTTLSFVAAHRLSDAFQARFLISAFILICTALYLRFGTQNSTILYGALYRIATTMAFWSVGLFLAPYPAWILYLILLPGLFFLFRIEVKAGKTPKEDLVAAGILLALTVFLTVQIQPLQIILFPDEVFHWKLYYQNSPVLILAGLGLMRLHKHAVWPGLCLLGTFLSLTGLLLLATIPMRTHFDHYSESLVMAVLAHAILLFFFIKNPLYQWFLNWTGLRSEERKRYRTQIFWLINLALQSSIVFLVIFHDENPSWVLLLLPVSVAGLLYQVQARTLAPAILELAILAFPVTSLAFPAIPLLVFIGIIGVLILLYSLLRRVPRLAHLTPNLPFLLIVGLFLVLVVQINPLSPLGLVLFAVPFFGWVVMPGRPFALTRQKHLLLWPFLAALVVFCLGGGYQPELLTVWAMACLFPPVALLVILRTSKVQEFSVKSGWFFLGDWAKTPNWALALVIAVATGICMVDFAANQSQYVAGWSVLARTLAVLGLAVAVFLHETIRKQRIKTAICTELFVWLILGLVRWKLDATEKLELGSPIDGYVLLGLGMLIAGIREAVRTRVPNFESYFHKTAQLYILAGWVYTLYLQVTNPGAFHGEIGSLVLALFYSWIARRRAKSHLLPAFLFGNIALILFFSRLDRDQVLFYLLPTLSSALVLAQLFKEELGANRVKMVRMVCGLVMLAATAFHNVLDFDASIWFPVTAALVSALVVLAGIAFRVRIYLFMGSSFFVLNTVASLIHVVRNQAPDQTKLLIGAVFLITGILFTGGFLFFQMKRQELLDRYNSFMRDLKEWE